MKAGKIKLWYVSGVEEVGARTVASMFAFASLKK